tara:strand:- start:3924 stop:4136 length:213 start_codon:yes stop_codon:yes gene_type:complete
MKILFVFSANNQRPKIAVNYFAKTILINSLSAPANLKICRKKRTAELTEDLLELAEVISSDGKRHFEQLQ